MPRLHDGPPGSTHERSAAGTSRVPQRNEDTLTSEEIDLLVELTQMTADILGFVDPTPTCDGISMVLSLTQGDFFGAAVSLVAMVPFIGDAAKLGKLPKYQKVLDKAIAQAKKSKRFETLAKPLLERLQEVLGRLPEFLPEKLGQQVTSIRGALDSFVAARVAKRLEAFKEAETLGIPVEHALAIRYAVMHDNPHRYIVFIREAKLAGLEWIRRGYPAKPREIKASTDVATGLVIAKSQKEIDDALAAGHYVVKNKRARNGDLVAAIRDNPEWGHMPDGLIIDKKTLKPFTSDFDVGTMIDPSSTGRNLATVSSNGVTPKDFLDPRERAMIEKMNRHMGGLDGGGRIMHGPDDKFAGIVREDRHIAFMPDGTMYVLKEFELREWMHKLNRKPLELKRFAQ